ncbi:ABC transporter permease [Aeromicrobium choanae]|uniref:Transport permease protein n=1 Tax=Aeromicrobium choanae TaxID=1736691 RepID=A0A1T4Z2X1_9ACTN|nr:ABC transporter permease [Aeromicrobium choanae]SKB08390.1 teichoic acid transport system permease protein [Aeromicrobium choanae]
MTPTVDDPQAHGLTRVGGRPPLAEYLRGVAQRKDFIVSLAKFRIEAENQRQRLGMLWIVLKPILNAAVFGIVFGILMASTKSVPDFVAFLIIGVFMFEFFSACMGSGSKSITSNQALVQSLAFPRMALPISVVVQKFLQLVPTIGLLMIFLVVMGHLPTWNWLLMLPLTALYFLFCLGVALITARLTVHLPDLGNLLPFITRFFFYTTGIFFSFDIRFEGNPRLLQVIEFQPVYAFLSLSRELLLDSDPLYDVRMQFWPIIAVWSIGLLVIGTVFFWAAEERYGRVD